MTTMTITDVQALLNEQAKAWNDGDAAGIADTYAAAGRLISPDGVVVEGREAIAAAFTMLFGGPGWEAGPPAWTGLFAGTNTEYTVEDVRVLAAGLVIADGTQLVGPLPPLHFTAVVGQAGEAAEIREKRPYAFLTLP